MHPSKYQLIYDMSFNNGVYKYMSFNNRVYKYMSFNNGVYK
jgi:hypothetical protein